MRAPPTRVEPLDHRDLLVAARIHSVLLLASAQEARLLGVQRAAPLDSTANDIAAGRRFYLGALRSDALLGVLSLGPDDEPAQLQIASLVVHPAHQRQGIARALLTEALRRSNGMVLSVTAGVDNTPALALYQGLGFVAYRHGSIGPENIVVVKLRRGGADVGSDGKPLPDTSNAPQIDS